MANRISCVRATLGSSISTVAWRIACGASETGAEQARQKLKDFLS
jgi:hypothetical protein